MASDTSQDRPVVQRATTTGRGAATQEQSLSRLRLVAAVAALTIPGAAVSAAPAAAEAVTAEPTQLIVSVAASEAAETVAALDERVEVLAGQVVGSDVATVQVAATDTAEAVAALSADPRVEYVEPDVVAHVLSTPSDALYAQQWGTHVVKVPQVWDTTTGAEDVVVAVIDTGVVQSHPDFAGAAFTAGWDFINDDADPTDDHGHGTGAAGVIAAQHNGSGTAGTCPDCTIMPLKAMGPEGTGTHSDIAAAINYAVTNGADIINLSLGSADSTITLESAVRRAADLGVLVIAAAGNAGTTTVFYPAGYPQAVAVAASAENDARYSWSNHGSWVELAAPGCNLAPSFDPANNNLGFANFCGTSSASPLVAGVAGLLLSAHPTTTAAAVRTALASTSVPVSYVSAGRVDAAAAGVALTGLDSVPEPDPAPEPVEPVAPEEETKAETATDVTLSSSVITYGQTVEVAGQLSTAEPGGAIVSLLSRQTADEEWTEVDRQTTDDRGAVSFSHTPDHTASYRLHFQGDESRNGSYSDAVAINVRAALTVAAPASLLLGRTYAVTGTFAPLREDATVRLERKTATGWKTVATQPVPATGRFAFAQESRVGKQRFRVAFAGDERNASSSSGTAYVTGDRVAVARVKPDAKGVDKRNLNGEFLVLTNNGKAPVELAGWGVRSRSTGRTFRLPAYRLPVGRTVVVHSGKGQIEPRHVHLDAGREVWRNGSDVAVVKHVSGGVAAKVRW